MKFYKFILIFVVIFSFLSCSSEKKPKDIIDQKTMSKILVDCYLAESFIAAKYSSDEQMKRENTQIFYNEIFAKYNVTPKQFRKSYSYYIANYSEMKDIYENTLNNLNAR